MFPEIRGIVKSKTISCMNPVLQCLVRTKPFTEFIIKSHSKIWSLHNHLVAKLWLAVYGGNLAKELYKLDNDMQNSKFKSCSSKNIEVWLLLLEYGT